MKERGFYEVFKKLPKSSNEDEERTFWETHDSVDYIDWSNAKCARFPNLKSSTEEKSDNSLNDDIINSDHEK